MEKQIETEDFGGLELEEPIKKHECPTCHKKFSHLWKCKDEIKRCKHCKNNQVTNKFYIPFKHYSEKMGKFSLSEAEKEQLVEQYKRQGMDSSQAWNRVHSHCRMLKRNYWTLKSMETKKRNKELNELKKIEDQRKKFLEGLK